MNWITVNNTTDLNELIDASKEKDVLIFKHSPRCGTSRYVLKNFENEFDCKSIDTFYVDVLESRIISNKIADALNIRHESPQAIIIKNGQVVYQASHEQIDANDMMKISCLN